MGTESGQIAVRKINKARRMSAAKRAALAFKIQSVFINTIRHKILVKIATDGTQINTDKFFFIRISIILSYYAGKNSCSKKQNYNTFRK